MEYKMEGNRSINRVQWNPIKRVKRINMIWLNSMIVRRNQLYSA